MRNPEIRKIQYKGISTSPDGYLCPDGELAGAMGVENLTGALTSASRYQPKKITLISTETGDEAYVVYIHKQPTYEHIIIAYVSEGTTTWYWKDVTDGYPERIEVADGVLQDVEQLFVEDSGLSISLSDVTSIHSAGNTLMILAGEIHYLVFKSDGDEGTVTSAHYHNLGTHIPEVPVSFGLQTFRCRYYENHGVKGYNNDEDTDPAEDEDIQENTFGAATVDEVTGDTLSDSNINDLSPEINAKLNKLVYEVHQRGYFCMPFLVRAALRMYDGDTITMHSAPVLMPVTTFSEHGGSISAIIDNYNDVGHLFGYHFEYTKAVLDYQIPDATLAVLQNWKDVIKGVEIYVSAPLYTHKQDEKIEAEILGKKTFYETTPENRYPYYTQHLQHVSTVGKILGSTVNEYSLRAAHVFGGGAFYEDLGDGVTWMWDNNKLRWGKPRGAFKLASKSVEDWNKQVKECSLFYLLKSIDIEDLQATRTVIKVPKDYLNTLVTHTLMTDEYQSHDTISAKTSFVFNSRLNLGGVSRKLYSGWDISSLIPYQNKGDKYPHKMTVKVVENGQTHVVSSMASLMPEGFWWQYLYYPNVNAKEMWLCRTDAGQVVRMASEEHTGLNGAVYMAEQIKHLPDASNSTVALIPQDTSSNISSPAKLYTSEVNNPWVYEPTNINTVGTGEILALSSATKALTDAQFSGSHLFSLYVFTSDGIWGAKPNGTGGWGNFEPVTRDVVSVPKAVLQIDDAVVFPTKRGLMMLQGAETVVLSEMLSDHAQMKVSEMPGMRRLLLNPELTDLANIFLADGTEPEQITDNQLDELFTPDPRTYFDSQQLRLLFDYTNQRIVACRRDKQYSLILSLDSKQWSAGPWQLVYKPESYPDCLVMLKTLSDHYILTNLSDRSGDAGMDDDYFVPQNGFILTRPIKIDGLQDALKELESAVHQGRFGRTKVKVIVYGTMDYKKWYLVSSSTNADIYRSHGQYYRAFAIALLLDLDEYDYLDTVTLQLEPRRTGRLHGMGYK